MTSVGSAIFLNTVMGWPMIPLANLYTGGPAYPLSSLGVRLHAQLTDNLSLLTGVFQDNPPGVSFFDTASCSFHPLGRQLQPAHRCAVHQRGAVHH